MFIYLNITLDKYHWTFNIIKHGYHQNNFRSTSIWLMSEQIKSDVMYFGSFSNMDICKQIQLDLDCVKKLNYRSSEIKDRIIPHMWLYMNIYDQICVDMTNYIQAYLIRYNLICWNNLILSNLILFSWDSKYICIRYQSCNVQIIILTFSNIVNTTTVSFFSKRQLF